MKELIARKQYANIFELKAHEFDGKNDDCIRVYCHQSPDSFTFQIRTFKPINSWSGKGKKRNMVATVSLSITQLEEILTFCKSQYPGAKRDNNKPLDLITTED